MAEYAPKISFEEYVGPDRVDRIYGAIVRATNPIQPEMVVSITDNAANRLDRGLEDFMRGGSLYGIGIPAKDVSTIPGANTRFIE
ncbi:hypothetical protein HYS92_00925 [Candidatus Daviesbacteria bacterium]|nr:hypothetical protein [Candidatus Daviesbacteria bacterium]